MQSGPSVASRKPQFKRAESQALTQGKESEGFPPSAAAPSDKPSGGTRELLLHSQLMILSRSCWLAHRPCLIMTCFVVMESSVCSDSFLLSSTTPNCIRGYPELFSWNTKLISCVFVLFVVVNI